MDLNQRCIDEAKVNMGRAIGEGYLSPDRVRVTHGNFFPPEFIEVELDTPVRDQFREELSSLAVGAERWAGTSETLQVAPGDIDLYFHYQVERAANVLQFFSDYARPGAVLAFVRTITEPPKALPDNIVRLGSVGPEPEFTPIEVFFKR